MYFFLGLRNRNLGLFWTFSRNLSIPCIWFRNILIGWVVLINSVILFTVRLAWPASWKKSECPKLNFSYCQVYYVWDQPPWYRQLVAKLGPHNWNRSTCGYPEVWKLWWHYSSSWFNETRSREKGQREGTKRKGEREREGESQGGRWYFPFSKWNFKNLLSKDKGDLSVMRVWSWLNWYRSKRKKGLAILTHHTKKLTVNDFVVFPSFFFSLPAFVISSRTALSNTSLGIVPSLTPPVIRKSTICTPNQENKTSVPFMIFSKTLNNTIVKIGYWHAAGI